MIEKNSLLSHDEREFFFKIQYRGVAESEEVEKSIGVFRFIVDIMRKHGRNNGIGI